MALVFAPGAQAGVESENPAYPRWAAESLMPLPDVNISVREEACPYREERACIYYTPRPTIYINLAKFPSERPRGVIGPRRAFFHELGHAVVNFGNYTERWGREVDPDIWSLCARLSAEDWADAANRYAGDTRWVIRNVGYNAACGPFSAASGI